MYTVIKNASVVTPHRVLEKHTVLFNQEVILEVLPDETFSEVQGLEIDQMIDAGGRYVTPGFVDIHCHGGAGLWAHEYPYDVGRYLLKHGTTALVATIAMQPTHKDMVHAVRNIASSINEQVSNLIGIHLEGPYMNPKYGAFREYARLPKRNEYLELFEAGEGKIRIWTIAPEMEGVEQMVFDLQLASQGQQIFGVGHSEASPEQIERLMPNGLRIATHCTNASGVSISPSRFAGTREMGVDEMAWLYNDLYAEVIADYYGRHVRPRMLQLMLKIKSAERLIIITDATALPNQAEGDPFKSESSVDDVAYTSDGGLGGSVLTMDRAASNMMRHTNCSIVDIFRMAALNPAKVLGMAHKMGAVAPGLKANLLLIDSDVSQGFRLDKVFLEGKEALTGE